MSDVPSSMSFLISVMSVMDDEEDDEDALELVDMKSSLFLIIYELIGSDRFPKAVVVVVVLDVAVLFGE